ncbi:MAG: aminotransferase class V-fold PLP-dependent enzyme [Gammaproteobacteria bacterium]|nr:aminotransferase class V-fold PLP-dependent enzyme [Gammaproteobacteria bacterium]
MILSDEFPQHPDLCYLNHAAVGPWPLRTGKAVNAFSQENVTWGATHYLEWMKVEKHLRAQLQTLLNVPTQEDIALVKNTSEGLSMIAYGIDWKPGENIVITDQEFPSNRIVWESLSSKGVQLKEVSLDSADPEAAIISAIDSNTRLVSVSSVQYASGFRLLIDKIGQFCQQQDVLFCVDAIQSLGVIPFDVEKSKADFVVADGHKWLLGPEGLAVFYSSPKARQHMSINEFGWHMVEHPGDFDRRDWTIAKSARRFECGSPNMLAIHALSASLSLLLETGIETIYQQLEEKIDHLISVLSDNPLIQITSATEKHRRAGIVTFEHTQIPSAELYKQLMGKQVICAHRGGGVRFSPHFYTSTKILDRAASLLP